MIQMMINAKNKTLHVFKTIMREGTVMSACESHLDEISLFTGLGMSDPKMRAIVMDTEMLDLEKRGPFLAFIVVLLHKGNSLDDAYTKSLNWSKFGGLM